MVDNRAARALFGERLGLAAQYADLLVTAGVVRGLIGPREAERIWDRHLLNCAAVAELIQPGAIVVDVGSGAGLPGVVLAVARPDLSVVLVEPLARRTTFLTEVVEVLGLDRSVAVVRSRAEEATGRLPEGPADIVTARAVAPLDRLTGWCLPLAAVGGRLLAIKGASAAEEAAAHRAAVRLLGGGPPAVRMCGVDLLDPPTTVVEIVREGVAGRPRGWRRAGRSSTSDNMPGRPGTRQR
jgi:16S rRNA (guanine527-N7)-methyltransferase